MKAEAENVARAIEEEPLPPIDRLRDQMLRMLRAAALTPGSATNDQIQAARVVLQQTEGQTDPLADLAKRLGGSKADLLDWMRTNVAHLEAELAKELPAATPAGEPSLPPTPPAKAEDAEPQ